jgi:hypothetical protein
MSRRAPSGLAWQVGEVYTLHFWPPYGDPEVQLAKHYTGWAEKGRLRRRLTDHQLGRGARLTQVQREAGGTWVVADVQPGTRDREQQLKERGAARRCEVCKAVTDYQAGQLTQPEALARAGWARATPHEREVLLDIFGIDQAPEHIPEPDPEVDLFHQAPEPRGPVPEVKPIHLAPEPQAVEITPELEAVVEALEARWRQQAQAQPEPEVDQPSAVPAPRRAPEPQAQAEITHEVDALESLPREAEAEPELEVELEI